MKKYFNSLFPWRWIPITILIGCSEFLAFMYHSITPIKYDVLIVFLIFPFWFLVDYIFGIGQRDIYERNKKQ